MFVVELTHSAPLARIAALMKHHVGQAEAPIIEFRARQCADGIPTRARE